jgi:hypothetical protein
MKVISISYLDRFGDIKQWEVIPISISFTRISNTNREHWVLEAKSTKTFESKYYLLENIKSIKEL